MSKNDELDKRIEQALQRLPIDRKIDLIAELIYVAWLHGNAAENVTVYEIARGAWVHYTIALRRAWSDLMCNKDLQISICGVLTALFYALIMARNLGR